MENIPEWYSDFFQLLPEREQESIDLQVEFDRSQRSEKLPPIQEMAEACLKLYRDKKIRSSHAAYLTGKLGNTAGMDKEVIELADRFGAPELKLWKGNALMMKGDYTATREIFEECEKKISQETPYAYLELKLFKINIVIATNEYELGLKENDELRDLIDFIARQSKGSINTDYFAVRGDGERLQILLQLGKMQEAESLVKKLKAMVEDMANLELRLNTYLILALYYHAIRDIKLAKEIFERCMRIAQDIGAKYEAAFTNGVLGAIAFSEGDKKTGERRLLEAIDVMEAFESLWDVIQFSMALSFQYTATDQLEKAYKLVKRIDKFLDRTEQVTVGFTTAITTIAIENEDLELARKYLDKSRFALIENPSKMYEIDLYFQEAALETVKLNFGMATDHIEKGLYVAEANDILPQVLSGKIRYAELNIDKWIQRENTRFINIASESLTDSLLIVPADSPTNLRLVLIQALVEILKGFNFNRALDLLEDAEKKIEEMNYGEDWVERHQKVQKKVISCREKFETQQGSPEERVVEEEIKVLIYREIKRIFSGIDMNKVSSAPVKQTEIKSLLVLNDAGLPIYLKHFSREEDKEEDLLLSGFLTALNQLSDILPEATDGHLKTIQHENYSILVEKVMSFTIAMVAVEETYEAHKKLHRFVGQLSKDELFSKYIFTDPTVTEKIDEFQKSVNGIIESIFIQSGKNSEKK